MLLRNSRVLPRGTSHAWKNPAQRLSCITGRWRWITTTLEPDRAIKGSKSNGMNWMKKEGRTQKQMTKTITVIAWYDANENHMEQIKTRTINKNYIILVKLQWFSSLLKAKWRNFYFKNADNKVINTALISVSLVILSKFSATSFIVSHYY